MSVAGDCASPLRPPFMSLCSTRPTCGWKAQVQVQTEGGQHKYRMEDTLWALITVLGKHKYGLSSYAYTCRSAVTFCSITMGRHSNCVHWYLGQQHFNSYLGEAEFVLVPWGSSHSQAADSAPSRPSLSGRRRRCR